MCGTSGVVSAGTPVDVASVVRLRENLRHRGPDGEGLYVSRDGSVALGYRRLSIIDLSDRARQPMCNEDGTLWVTYNGEICNFKELRSDLEKMGHVFRTDSDTEVILHGYEAWGEDYVARFRGMFAFAVWDEIKSRLFLARDRVGIKPLLYYWDGRTFMFASELKAVIGYPGLDDALDLTAIYDHLTYLYILAPKTAYKRI